LQTHSRNGQAYTSQPAEQAQVGGVMEEASGIWQDLMHMLHDHLRIATLETRLVAENLVGMVVTSVGAVLLAVTAWLALVAAGVAALVENDVTSVTVALLIAVAVNVAAAVGLGFAIRRQVKYLQWPATLRSMKPTPPRMPEDIHAESLKGDNPLQGTNTRH
jgi:hypothetical protein